ncbi:putative glycosidase CRH2 [Pleosporales sp. CAS-2024a]
MFPPAITAAFAAATLVGSALAGATCTKDNHCPQDSPCCSLYGDCGVGAFCLGGCDPTMSHSFDSCVPGPVCKSGTYTLDSLNNVQTIDSYLGDASKIDWQSQGTPAIYTDPSTGQKSTLLTMAQGTVGTLLASTHYVWYGKICSKLSTSQGKGVVTAFILMSDVKDEIDFEWVGADVSNVQSNFYSQGVTDYHNSANLSVAGGNTASTIHEYCIDWTQDKLTWSIDGNSMRTLNRKDTWNATANRFAYPQTPARVMLSLWPAGLPSNAKGTVEWAGGEIDWNSPYMQNGYYFARFQEVTVQCYDPPSGIQTPGNKVYQYTNEAATNNTVEITNNQVILGSLMGTGDNPGTAPKSGSPQPSATVAMVPGGNPGGGAMAQQSSGANQGASGASQTGSAGGSSSGGQTVGGSGNVGWSQGASGGSSASSTGAAASVEPGLGRIGGSALAIVVAIFGLCAL